MDDVMTFHGHPIVFDKPDPAPRTFLVSYSAYEKYLDALRPWLEAQARLMMECQRRGLRPTQVQFTRWERRHSRGVHP